MTNSICDTCEYLKCEVTWDDSYFICERDANPELYNTPDHINYERCRLYKKIIISYFINITLCFKDDIKTNDMFYISKIENNSNGMKKIELEKIRKFKGE